MGAAAVVAFYSADIKEVFAQAAEQNGGKVHLIWLQLAGDSGCTISMLQASNPDLIEAVQDLSISADYWQTLMTPDYDLGWVTAGYTSEINSQVPLMNAAFGDAPVDVLVVEGSPQLGTPEGAAQGDYCEIGQYNGNDVNGYQLLQKLAAKATYVIAIGQCSSFGGVPAAKGNLTGAVPVTEALKTAGVATKNPVVNIPGCPAQPDWTLVTLASVLQGFNPELDDVGRPTAFFSHYVHDQCPRRGYYDKGQFASNFDDPECLYDLGCKGPITLSACAETKWNGGVGFCTQNGPMCWGCMHPNFPDPPTSGFFESLPHFPGIDVPMLEVAGAAALVVGAGIGIGLNARSKKTENKEDASGSKT
jgi:hydrogenase small subunit